jgi:flagellar basal-body rod modification protein FlgD
MATETSAYPITKLINPTASTYASTSASTTAASTSGSSAQLGEADFLSLLTTQLQNQDPLSPMDDTQSVAELAQFSQLQSQQSLTSSFNSFESNSAVQQAASMLGASVSVSTTDSSGNSSTVSGTVKAIQVVNGQPEFTMVDSSGNTIAGANGTPTEFNTSQILTISQ